MELENFFNNDNISKSKNSYTVSLFYSYYDKNLFKRYHDLKQDLIRHYDLLQEYKTTYDNFILGPVYDYVFQEDTEWTNVRVANVSILDESYSIYFKPLTFEL